jgi:hypothetical protein
MMKATRGLLVLFSALLVTGAALAERAPAPAAKPLGKAEEAPLLADTERYKTAISSSRRKLFEEAMSGLSPEAREVFWTTYGDYERDKDEIAAARVEVVETFTDHLASPQGVSDEDITAAVHGLTALQNEVADLRLKYFGIISERIDVTTAGRFALIDDYVTTSIRLEWLNQIPFPGDGAE